MVIDRSDPAHQVVIEQSDFMNFERKIYYPTNYYLNPTEILSNKLRDPSIEEFERFREERELTMTFKSSTMHFDCKGFSWSVASAPEIKNVIFNNPATIVFWEDGTKTVVKCENEEFDKEKGLAMAFMKKMLGNRGRYFNEVKKWTR